VYINSTINEIMLCDMTHVRVAITIDRGIASFNKIRRLRLRDLVILSDIDLANIVMQLPFNSSNPNLFLVCIHR
jgi:hypothetical protein